VIYSGIYRPIMICADPISGPPVAQVLPALQSTHDLSDLGGRGRIAGTVKVDSTPDYPAWRRVRLFAKRDNRLAREVWSDPVTGAYSFDYVSLTLEFVVIAYDHTGAYNAEIRDAIHAEAMP
jgi:hypothetical protein